MGQPAVVANDRIVGSCANHMVPSPSGSPMPSPGPLPFSAPLTTGLATTVKIGGKFAAVQGSSGVNKPGHPGLHASDPFIVAPSQKGKVVAGSGSVTFDGKPAAYSGCQVTCCVAPGQVTGTATKVTVAP
ncbi:MAG TPA: PAAR domain-containing protein [Mycobacteriales bacterium]|nr:PAAR domain-containing protein [Mycobacteriales bacterium]